MKRATLDTPDSSVRNGHRRNGTFAPGNKAHAGRGTELREWRAAFRETLTPKMLAEVTLAMHRAALKGNVHAGRLLFEYALGRPTLKLDLSHHSEPADMNDPANDYLRFAY